MSKSAGATSVLCVVATLLIPAAAQAAAPAEGPWLVRARAVHIDSADKDSTGLGLALSNKTIPEVDISYFFAPNVAAELILTYPQKHRLYSNGAEIGTLKHLPPVLSLQYHFNPAGSFRPYAGVGINYTHFSNARFAPAVEVALAPTIKKNSVGVALQLGADIEVGKGMYLNLDLKKVRLGTTVYSRGASVGKFKVDPLLVGAGLGWRF